jgi:MFS family permease
MSKYLKIKMQRRWLYGISFLLGFQTSLVTYITSLYFKEASGINNIGIFYFGAYLAAWLVLLNMHFFIKRFGKSGVFLSLIFIQMLALLAAAICGLNFRGIFWVLLMLFSSQLMWAVLDIIIENYSDNKITGSIRGLNLTILNFGWLAAPFFATRLLDRFGYSAVYVTGAGFVFITFWIALFRFAHVNHNIQKACSIREVLKKMSEKQELSRIYYVSLILEIFYAAMVVYTPIYLSRLGFSVLEMGSIFTVMLIPFVLVQYPFGVMADRKTGEKEWLIISIIIMAAATAAIALVDGVSVWVWMLVLFLTRVGAAIVEVLRDSYFFKKVDDKDVDLINFYKTTRSFGYLIVTVFFSFLQIFMPLQWMFFVLAAIILTALLPLYGLKDSK